MIQKSNGWLDKMGINWFWYRGAGWIQKRGEGGWCMYTRRWDSDVGREMGRCKWYKYHETVLWGRLFGYRKIIGREERGDGDD